MKRAILVLAIITLILLSGCPICKFFGIGGTKIAGLRDRSGNTIQSGDTTTERVQTIYGTVENPGTGDVFEGAIILVFNDEERFLDAADDGYTYGDVIPGDNSWAYEGELVLDPGPNTFCIVVKDTYGNTVTQTETITITANIPAMDIIARLTWDTDLSDVDLHVYDPCERHTYWDNMRAIPDAELDIDDIDGYGPETFTMQSGKAVSGTYTIKVRYYNDHYQTAPTNTRVRITVKGGTAQTFGPHTFTQDMANYSDPSNDWIVTTFTVPGATGRC